MAPVVWSYLYPGRTQPSGIHKQNVYSFPFPVIFHSIRVLSLVKDQGWSDCFHQGEEAVLGQCCWASTPETSQSEGPDLPAPEKHVTPKG